MLSKKGALNNILGKEVSIDKQGEGIYINQRHKEDLYYTIDEIGADMFSATIYLRGRPSNKELFSIDKIIGIDGRI